LLKWYREDGDTGIHGAIDWLLRHDKDGLEDRPLKWGQAEKLAEIDKSFSGRIEELPKERNWVVNGEGQTFAILDSREAFLMSSPVTEKDRFDSNELQHWRKLDRKFGISTKAVTVEQFERFKKANPVVTHTYTKKYAPESACPQVSVTWYEAIAYCRWLSEEEGIPETEWVYPLTVKEIMAAAAENKALMMPQDYLKRKGYRLLSEAEWEYSARSGTQSAYHFGDSVELLREYGWYTKNTNDAQSFPVGEKKPNEWGLFDMTGNSYSWVQDRFLRYPNGSRLKPGLDVEDKQSITDNEGRVLRGGSFLELASFLRSSVRADGRPSSRNVIIGFRLSRTFD
jgi:formylglycine-generating enzyme required for sulfatase activity